MVEPLIIEADVKSPKILFDAGNGIFRIEGRSIPENSIQFYTPVWDWLKEYQKQPLEKTEVVFHLEYFNTSSSKCLVDILRHFEEIAATGKLVTIRWEFEKDDEDMEESGKDFSAILKIPFNMVPY